MEDLVSVIVPIYNCENYIKECLDSIFCQDYKNIEVICVDDGSNDHSKDAILKYDKVRYFYQTNKGQGAARNLGIEKANGEWLVFCDSDDFIESNFISKMMAKTDSSVDLVCCNIRRVVDGKFNYDNMKFVGNMNASEGLVNLNPGPTNKLFRKKLFANVKFIEERKRYEDLAIFPSLIVQCNRIVTIDDCLYNYRIYENSTMRKWDDKVDDIFYILDYIKNKPYYDEYKDEIDYLIFKHGMFGHISRIVYFDYKKILEEYKQMSKYVRKQVPDYWQNKFIKNDKTLYFKVGLIMFKMHMLVLLIPILKVFEKYIKR